MVIASKITAAIQGFSCRPQPVNHRSVVRQAVDWLDRESLVVLSGPNRPFLENRGIGKSLSCRRIFMMLLQKEPPVEQRDIKQTLNITNQPNPNIDLAEFDYRTGPGLQSARYYIFDEFHHSFPRDPACRERDHWGTPVYRGEDYNQSMFAFWGRLQRMREAGSRFLLVTALHPQRAEYRQFMFDPAIPAMADYFKAPALELQFMPDD